MCSWRFLPACRTKMTWSTPACSKRSRYSRTCAGVPVAPRSPVRSPAASFAPSRSTAQRRLHLRRIALVAAPLQILGPDIGRAGPVLAEDVVVAERVAEEVASLQAAVERHLLVAVTHHLGHAGDVGVHDQPDRNTTLSQGPLVVGHPFLRLLGIDEGEQQRRRYPSRPPARWCPGVSRPPTTEDGASASAWERRCAAASGRSARSTPVNGVSVMQRSVTCNAFEARRGALGRRIDQEPAQPPPRSRIPRPELDPAARDEVQVLATRSAVRAGVVVASDAVWMMP